MSEMEQTSDHVLVVGEGRLIADLSVAKITQRSALSYVKVVSPRAHELSPHLEAKGAMITNGIEKQLTVTGLDAPSIGGIAFELGLRLNELSPRRATLEDAFMELTHDSVDFRAHDGSTADVASAKQAARELAAEPPWLGVRLRGYLHDCTSPR